MGTAVLGFFGFPLFLRGLALQVKAQRAGLSVRPIIVTLIGYLVIIDSALNSFGWALDMIANHTLIDRVVLTAWGNMFDAGYFWHYNELWIGGASAPGEKAWEIALSSDRVPHAPGRRDRLPADEALGPPVADRHLLVRRAHLDRLRRQHDHVRRHPLLRTSCSR